MAKITLGSNTGNISNNNNSNIPKLEKIDEYDKEIVGDLSNISKTLDKLGENVQKQTEQSPTDTKILDNKIEKSSNLFTTSLEKLGSTFDSIKKSTETTFKNTSDILLKSLSPFSLLLDPIQDLTGLNITEKLTSGIGSIFKKKDKGDDEGVQDKMYKGSPKRNKILKRDPGSVLLFDMFKKADKDNKKDKKGLKLSPKALLGIIGGGLVIGGIGTLISGLFDDGPFKGLKKLGGRAMLDIGKLILKKIGTTLGKFFNFLTKPFKGLLDNLMKPFKGVLDNVIMALKGTFDNIIKGIGGKVFGKLLGKGGGKGIFKMISKKLAPILGKFSKALKGVPFLGAIISTGFAISRFKKGDIVGGLLDLASGVASIFPGIGTAISYGIEFISTARDLGAFKKGGVLKFNVLDIMKKFFVKVGNAIGNWFSGMFTSLKQGFIKVFDNIGKFFSKLWEGVSSFFGKAISKVGSFLGGAISGISEKIKDIPIIGKIFKFYEDTFTSFFGVAKQLFTDPLTLFQDIGAKIKGFFGGIGDFFNFLIDGIKNPISFAKELKSEGFGGAFTSYRLEEQGKDISEVERKFGNTGVKEIDEKLAELKMAQSQGELVDVTNTENMIKGIIKELNEQAKAQAKSQSKTQVNNIQETSTYDVYKQQQMLSYGS